MFQTDISWSDIDRTQFLGRIFGQPGIRIYNCIEIASNFRIFHVDILLADHEVPKGVWSRFLFYDIATLIGFLSDDKVIASRICMQSIFEVSAPYSFVSVLQISSGEDFQGKRHYVLKCEGIEPFVFASAEIKEYLLINKVTVWRSM